MRVRDILANKGTDVLTISVRATIAEVLNALAEHEVGALVVTSDDTPVAGIISERDIVRHLRDGAGVVDAPVAAIMTSDVRTCAPEASIESVLTVMNQGGFRHLPVVQDRVLVGMVTIRDVVNYRIDQLQSERDTMASFFTH